MPSTRPGTICVLSGDLSRYGSFWASFSQVNKPPGTVVDCVIGYGIVPGINSSITRFLASAGDWWWLMADDHVFGEDLLMALLARELPIVAPLNVQRHHPFAPLLYAAAVEEGVPVHQYTWKHLAHMAGLYKLPARASCGSAGMLIQRDVLTTLGTSDWFQDRPGLAFSEDLYFCERVRAHGYPVYVDLDCRMGHLFPTAAVPVQTETGEWLVGLQVHGKSFAYLRY